MMEKLSECDVSCSPSLVKINHKEARIKKAFSVKQTSEAVKHSNRTNIYALWGQIHLFRIQWLVKIIICKFISKKKKNYFYRCKLHCTVIKWNKSFVKTEVLSFNRQRQSFCEPVVGLVQKKGEEMSPPRANNMFQKWFRNYRLERLWKNRTV